MSCKKSEKKENNQKLDKEKEQNIFFIVQSQILLNSLKMFRGRILGI